MSPSALHWTRYDDRESRFPRVDFALMVAPVAVMAVRLHLYRFLFIVGTSLGTGGAGLLLRTPGAVTIAILFAATGTMSVVTGTCALYSYLLAYPRSELDGEHGV